MFKAVHHCCTGEHQVIENIAPFVIGVNTLGHLITAIECMEELISLRPGETARDKNAVRLALCRITASNLATATVFAANNQDEKLEKDLSHTLQDLKKMPADQLTDTARELFNTIYPLAPRLAVYGLTMGVINAWNFVINTYSPNFKSPKAAMLQRKNLATCFGQLFKDGIILCDSFLDPLAESLKKKNPEFLNEYSSRRKSISPEVMGGAGIRGTIKAKNPDSPRRSLQAVAGATVTLVETGVVVKSDDEGCFVFRAVKKGTYSLRAEKKGFFTKTSASFEHSERETSEIPFELSLAEVEVLQY